MNLKILKFLTIVSFLLITFNTGHIGGSFWVFLFLGLLSGGKETFFALIILLVLLLFLINAIIPRKTKKDLYLFLIGGIILLVPILMHLQFLIVNGKNGKFPFYISSIIFLIIYCIALIEIKKVTSFIKS